MTTHLSTGFKVLDAVINGLNGGELVLIGGRPGMGKTSFALNLALNAANGFRDKERSGVAFFSMEQSSLQLSKRFLSTMTQIPFMTPEKGQITPEKFRQIVDAAAEFEKMPLYIDDTPALTLAALCDRCRKMKGLGLVVIDYLQLFKDKKKGSVLPKLKETAQKLNVPIIVLSQLTRAAENRKDKRPRLGDIRTCKDLSVVDKVLFLYRESYYLLFDMPERKPDETEEAFYDRKYEWEKRLSSTEKDCEIIVAKNTSGDCGTVNLRFDGMTGSFSE